MIHYVVTYARTSLIVRKPKGYTEREDVRAWLLERSRETNSSVSIRGGSERWSTGGYHNGTYFSRRKPE